MKKIINYEKDILFKTNIGELTSISLEHDFTVDEGVLKGDFLVSGEYKPNELSVNKEPFDYRLPLEYELDPKVDIDTLSYDIDDFEYTVKDDCLTVFIDFKVRYEEKNNEPIIPEITEDEINTEDVELPVLLNETREDTILPMLEEKDEIVIDKAIEKDNEEDSKEDRLDDKDKDAIVETLIEEDSYVIYHVHIVREGDTLESIAAKYGCTTDLIKEYNDFETLELKTKLLIPDVKDE